MLPGKVAEVRATGRDDRLRDHALSDSRRRFSRGIGKLLRNPSGMFGLISVLIFVLAGIFAPWLTPHDPLAQSLQTRLLPPFWDADGSVSYFLGTDALGRDILSRIIQGSRISLLVGFVSVGAGSIIGVALGLVAGYRGGRVDSIIMRLADVQLSFPSLILALAVMAILGQGLRNIILVLAITGWVQYARVIRSRVLSIREAEFVVASRTIGASHNRIMFRHILPNVLSPIIVIATFALPQMILAEASLSFLGVGIPLPTPTWGNMLAEAQNYVATAWWLSVAPGLALMICLLGINLLGDWLRDALDPRLKNL